MGEHDNPDERLRGRRLGSFKAALVSPSNRGLGRLAVQGHRRELDEHGEPYSHVSAAGPATTQVADGLPRRAWTVDEVERMVAYGVLREPEPFELIGGELVAMAPKDRRHEVIRTELGIYWSDRRGRDLKIVSETPLRLGDYDAPEPDLIVFPATLLAPDVRADTVLLVVEIADSSLRIDLSTKRQRYAASGVQEYWVIDASSLLTTVHREPRPDGEYAYRDEVQATQMLVPTLALSLAVRLADLSLG